MASPLVITLAATCLLLSFSSSVAQVPDRSFALFLHCFSCTGQDMQDTGVMEFLKDAEIKNWSFPTASLMPITWAGGNLTYSWFDMYEFPIAASSRNDEKGLLEAVKGVHALIDKEVAAGTSPENIFIVGYSQGGALTIASILLYPKTLGGGAISSGWVPFDSSLLDRITPEARKTHMIWTHGDNDTTVLPETAHAGQAFLKQVGISCEFVEYAGDHLPDWRPLTAQALWMKAHLVLPKPAKDC